MIQLTPNMQVFIALEPTDFRKGIDGLARSCRVVFNMDPFSGAVFVFRNRSKTSLKLYYYDGQGGWLCQKRLSSGKFQWWPKKNETGLSEVAIHELQTLLWNGNPDGAGVAPFWRKISTEKPG